MLLRMSTLTCIALHLSQDFALQQEGSQAHQQGKLNLPYLAELCCILDLVAASGNFLSPPCWERLDYNTDLFGIILDCLTLKAASKTRFESLELEIFWRRRELLPRKIPGYTGHANLRPTRSTTLMCSQRTRSCRACHWMSRKLSRKQIQTYLLI